jgi:hypothetical protein
VTLGGFQRRGYSQLLHFSLFVRNWARWSQRLHPGQYFSFLPVQEQWPSGQRGCRHTRQFSALNVSKDSPQYSQVHSHGVPDRPVPGRAGANAFQGARSVTTTATNIPSIGAMSPYKSSLRRPVE